jgi:hypothetical protein
MMFLLGETSEDPLCVVEQRGGMKGVVRVAMVNTDGGLQVASVMAVVSWSAVSENRSHEGGGFMVAGEISRRR